jgi:hypothetical protein
MLHRNPRGFVPICPVCNIDVIDALQYGQHVTDAVRYGQVDPKEAAKRKAAQARAEAKAADLARDAIGTRSITSFFAGPKRARP